MAWLKKAALVVCGLVLGLACVEGALRTAGWLFLRQRTAGARAFVKTAPGYRVLCLGESTTADMQFLGKESYPAQLERRLNRRGSAGFSVINGGVPATTSDAIVAGLPANLERYDPDIVVTMMGINDGESIDPIFQVSQGSETLRVWKLARMLSYALQADGPLFAARDGAENPPSGGPGAAGPAGVTPAVRVSNVPRAMMGTQLRAYKMIFDGRYAHAEALLTPLLDIQQTDRLIVKVRAYGQLAVLNWQRGDEREAERYRQLYEDWYREHYNSRTKRNYAAVRRILAERGIPLVAVQYPGRSAEPLRRLVDADPAVVIVDNEEAFVRAVKTRPLRDTYRDLFAGIFGHLTPYGNRLLARKVAAAVLALVADARRAPGEQGARR